MSISVDSVPTKPFMLAMSILDLPAGPTYKELAKQARQYIKGLKPEELQELTRQAIEEKSEYKDDYVDKLDLFKQLGFTSRECQAYANMRIDSPGVRKMIARRALLMAMRKWDKLPAVMIHPDVCMMEDAFLTDDAGTPLTEEQILQELSRIRKMRR